MNATPFQDLRHALRRLRRDWMFAATAVAILAVGIGANTAVFSVVNAVLFRPQSFPEPDSLVKIYQTVGAQRVPEGVSFPALQDLAQQTQVFGAVGGVITTEAAFQVDGELLQNGIIEYASSGLLPAIDLRPARGRWFRPDEDVAGAAPVAVIGYKLWTDQFHSDPAILGRVVRLGHVAATIVGVAPPDLHNTQSPVVFDSFLFSLSATPGFAETLQKWDSRVFQAVARLRSGVTRDQAQAALGVLAARWKADDPTGDRGEGIIVLRSRDVRFGPRVDAAVRPAAVVALGLIGLILAIACANLATLLLVRGSVRAKELAVRVALGASRWQLVRLMLTESVLLAAMGALGGWALTQAGIRYLHGTLPVDFGLDLRVFLYVTVVALIAGIGSGLAPALASTKGSLASGMREQSGTASGGGRWWSLRNVLIVGQVAASFLLLLVTGFGVRLLAQGLQQDPGYRVAGLAVLQTDTRFAGYDRARELTLMQEVVRRVEAVPGVESVLATGGLGVPPGDSGDARVLVEGAAKGPDDRAAEVLFGWGSVGFVKTLQLPLLHGRDFAGGDLPDSPKVALVNATMARQLFGQENAVGRRFHYTDSRQGSLSGDAEVIGVVADAHEADNLGFVSPLFYLSSVQAGMVPTILLARGNMDAGQLAQRMQTELRNVERAFPARLATSMQAWRDDGVRPWTMGVSMLGGLAALGLGLAGLGLYAVVAFAVARRAQEVGIRMALGARGAQVIWLMMRDVMLLTTVGVGLGGLASAGALAILSASVAATSRLPAPVTDPWNFVAISAAMAAVGAAAAYVPARRAARIDPLAALRDA